MKRQPSRLNRLELTNRVPGRSTWQVDLDLLSVAPENFLDTVLFPPPSWAVSAFGHAAKKTDL